MHVPARDFITDVAMWLGRVRHGRVRQVRVWSGRARYGAVRGPMAYTSQGYGIGKFEIRGKYIGGEETYRLICLNGDANTTAFASVLLLSQPFILFITPICYTFCLGILHRKN